MSETPDKEDADEGSLAVRELLKRSLSADALPVPAPSLLAGVQRRIRRRSRGKFFRDGWSTMQTRLSYLLVGLITLLIVALALYALAPWDIR
ncbi:MAG TPA: hypothetical protein VGY54_27890 [Polyangiaceae bacterium]|jgi:hypothetical protein|nr:hypothetical protein [Polyangiaceae bacterium]